MILIPGVDYSYARPRMSDLTQFEFVGRYIPTGTPGKDTSLAEVNELHAARKDVIFFYESTAGRALQGYGAGVQDAMTAAHWLSSARAPAGVTVYFTVDSSTAQPAGILNYFAGASHYMGPEHTGVYGFNRVVRAVLDAGYARYACQTGENTPLEHGAQVQQWLINQNLNGHAVDYLHAVTPAFGQWAYPGHVITPPPVAAPKPAPQPPVVEDTQMIVAVVDNDPNKCYLISGDLTRAVHVSNTFRLDFAVKGNTPAMPGADFAALQHAGMTVA